MKQKFLCIVCFLSLASGVQSVANAAMIVSFKQTSLTTSQNVVVQVFASATAGTENVGAYGFFVDLGKNASGLSATFAGQSTSAVSGQTNWSGMENGTAFGNIPSGVDGSLVLFRGGGFTNESGEIRSVPPAVFVVTIGAGQTTGTGLDPGTFLGTFSFTALDRYTGFVPIVIADSTGLGPALALNGFVGNTSTNIYPPITLRANGFADGTITAVPEPSSMALVGLCVGGLGFGMVRARRNRMDSTG